MSERMTLAEEQAANEAARFLPQVDDDTHPAVEVAGALVFVYVKDGELVVAVDLDESRLAGEGGTTPLRVTVQGERVYAAS